MKNLIFIGLLVSISQEQNVNINDIASGFNSFITVTNTGGGSNRSFVSELGGRKIEANGNHLNTPFLDISAFTK